MSKFKVGDLVRCIEVDAYVNKTLVLDSVYEIEALYSYGLLKLKGINGEFFTSRFKLVPQKESESLIPTSVAEYIEHLELREEALEQLVSDLTRTNTQQNKALDNFSKLTTLLSTNADIADALNAKIGDDVVEVLSWFLRNELLRIKMSDQILKDMLGL